MDKYILIVLVLFFNIYFENTSIAVETTNTTVNDTNTLKLYFEIEDKLIKKNLPDSALYYNNLCAKTLEKLNAPNLQHQCYHYYVRIYHARGDFKMALEYCLKSIAVAKQNKNKFQEATTCRAIFNIYHNLNMNDSAVKYAIYSIKLTTEIGDTANIAINYGNLSWMYMDLNQYDKAIDYAQKGIEAGQNYGDTVGMLVSINNLALCYLRTSDNEKAIELLKKQLKIGKLFNRPRSIRFALVNLGTIYYTTGNIHELEKATSLLNDYNDNDPNLDNKNKCLQHINTAYNFIYHKNFKQAEAQLLAALKIAEADSLIDQLLNIYLNLSKVEFAQHNFAKGNYYEKKWDVLDEKINATELAEYAEELETKYEVEKKSAKIMLQESQLRVKSILNYVVAGAGIGVLIISFLTYRALLHKHRLQKQKIIELETRHLLTATEAVLKGEEQERTRLAKDLHDGLGGMLSGIKYSFTTMKGNLIMTPENHQAFERSMDMLDSSIKEMRRVAHNMMPEALLRFGLDTALKDFCNDINQSGALKINYQSIGLKDIVLEETVSITLYRIVQELLNNIMKHSGACTAIVQIVKTNNQLSLTVEDDGRGFDTKLLDESRGIGWGNIKNRVEFLKGKLHISSQIGEGTSVMIELNV